MKITFIGAGNVASHLAKAFYQTGAHQITQVIARTLSSAKELAEVVNASYSIDIFDINPDTDIIIISVPDDEIDTISSQIKLTDKVVVHTSGATSIDVLNGKFKDFGVFYPLQTFTKGVPVSLGAVPICIEANQPNIESVLAELGESVSNDVQRISSEEREKLHVAAVFANNFTNYLYQVSDDILNGFDLNFDLLKPLIQQTANKINYLSPKDAQTGPAVRDDQETINHHLEILKSSPQYMELYDILSKQIRKSKGNS